MRSCLIMLGLLSAALGCDLRSAPSSPVASPYPPSPLIRRIDFAPPDTIWRAAEGSDNWPITWGDDERLYTAYGDGFGFDPGTERKLSLGLATITGDPPRITGQNLRTPSGEQIGDGPNGLKASGLLMVDGTLFMLVRNADRNGNGSRLQWSSDSGSNWTEGFAFHPEFGCPTFLNAGPNHRNSEDGYVYVYSQQGVNAYTSYDHVVLARAPRQDLRSPRAWQYFSGLDAAGGPSWSSDPGRVAPILSFEDHCFRLEAVYLEALDRYFLLMAHNFTSGWSMFDAPAPWGPWTTAFHTPQWDLAGIHGYRLPIKWFDPRRNSFFLLFSGLAPQGYDAFCLREAQLILR